MAHVRPNEVAEAEEDPMDGVVSKTNEIKEETTIDRKGSQEVNAVVATTGAKPNRRGRQPARPRSRRERSRRDLMGRIRINSLRSDSVWMD